MAIYTGSGTPCRKCGGSKGKGKRSGHNAETCLNGQMDRAMARAPKGCLAMTSVGRADYRLKTARVPLLCVAVAGQIRYYAPTALEKCADTIARTLAEKGDDKEQISWIGASAVMRAMADPRFAERIQTLASVDKKEAIYHLEQLHNARDGVVRARQRRNFWQQENSAAVGVCGAISDDWAASLAHHWKEIPSQADALALYARVYAEEADMCRLSLGL